MVWRGGHYGPPRQKSEKGSEIYEGGDISGKIKESGLAGKPARINRLHISDEEILAHYTYLRKIEVMFKHQKCIWVSNFMARSAAKAIDRLFVIFPLAYFFFPAF